MWPAGFFTPDYFTPDYFNEEAAPPAPGGVQNDIIDQMGRAFVGGAGRSIV